MRGELETEQNCNILTPPTLLTIIAFLSRSHGLLNRGLGAQVLLRHGSHSSIFSPTVLTSCAPGYIIFWRPPTSCERHNSHSIQPVDSQGYPPISSTGCTCYLHRCISYFDSSAGANMQQLGIRKKSWNFSRFTLIEIFYFTQLFLLQVLCKVFGQNIGSYRLVNEIFLKIVTVLLLKIFTAFFSITELKKMIMIIIIIDQHVQRQRQTRLYSSRRKVIIIIMSRRQRGYPWPSLAISPYHSSPPAGLQGYILCPHIVAVCMFVLVVPLSHIHMWGSTGVHRLWARPCFSSSVVRVWFVELV